MGKENYLTKEQLVKSYIDYEKQNESLEKVYAYLGCDLLPGIDNNTPETVIKIFEEHKKIHDENGKKFIEIIEANEKLTDEINELQQSNSMLRSVMDFYNKQTFWDRLFNKKPYKNTTILR